jgi:predicted outer membrane lipoprotein
MSTRRVLGYLVSACAFALIAQLVGGCVKERAKDVETAEMRREMARLCEAMDPKRLDRDCDHWREIGP